MSESETLSAKTKSRHRTMTTVTTPEVQEDYGEGVGRDSSLPQHTQHLGREQTNREQLARREKRDVHRPISEPSLRPSKTDC